MSAIIRGLGASRGEAKGPLSLGVGPVPDGAVLLQRDAGAEDADNIRRAAALVFTRAGLTGDGAIMARALGKPCVVGLDGLVLFEREGFIEVGGQRIAVGTELTVNGSSGEITLP
ncbi:MAG: PEP-utilizing enzyme [Polyangiaceae bacterium]